jgi:hypothetical protein
MASHRLSRTSEYKSWSMMRTRCNNPNYTHYSYYGGRGISVCDRWMESFENFINDMGMKPPGYMLDRKDSNGNYEPNNCKWSSREEQVDNRRNGRAFELGDIAFTLKEWGTITGIHRAKIYNYIYRGYSFVEALVRLGCLDRLNAFIAQHNTLAAKGRLVVRDYNREVLVMYDTMTEIAETYDLDVNDIRRMLMINTGFIIKDVYVKYASDRTEWPKALSVDSEQK